MNRRWLMVGAVGAVALAFIAGVVVYKDRTAQEAVQAVQAGGDALVRAHAPVFGNPRAQVTIVEFFDPSCEACRAFYPLVKSIVNASFGQARLVVRYAPLHPGSDRAAKILEAARLQGKYWPALEQALADQPRWRDTEHHFDEQVGFDDLVDDGPHGIPLRAVKLDRACVDAALKAAFVSHPPSGLQVVNRPLPHCRPNLCHAGKLRCVAVVHAELERI